MRLGSTLDIPVLADANLTRRKLRNSRISLLWGGCLTVPPVRPAWGTCAACLPPLDMARMRRSPKLQC